MSVNYSGKHSINLYSVTNSGTTKKNTWDDFHLIPTVRPFIVYPVPNTRIVSLPGTSKRVDLTDYHFGGLTFGRRKGSWEFYVDHDQWSNWKAAYNAVYDFVHGKELYAALNDEPTLFYIGMFSVGDYTPSADYSKIIIGYDLGYDSFVCKEEILGDGEVSLLNECPIKFIGENGAPYADDYGFVEGADYIIDLETNKKEISVYDLTVL